MNERTHLLHSMITWKEITQNFMVLDHAIQICSPWKWKKQKKKVAQSCLTLWLHGLHNPWNSPGQNTGVGSLFLFQGLFSTQGLNPRLLHCRQILYQLSHQGSPRILEWVGIPFSSGSCQPRNRIRVSHIAGRFFTNWAIREAQCSPY